MHVHFLDPYRPRQSVVHQLDPRVKLILTLAFILTASLMPIGAWPAYILLATLSLALILLSELGIRHVLQRASLALAFVLAALPIIFNMPGPYLTEQTIGPWLIRISLPGLERFFSIAIKSWVSLQAAIVLAESTPFPQLLAAMRAIKVPRLLVAIFSLMWRYLFVLADEALRLTRARAARSGESDLPGLKPGQSVAWRARVTGGMVGNLFLRAFERSDRIYMAMVSRGYDGEVRALAMPGLNPPGIITLVLGLILLATLLFLSLLLWG